MSIILENIDETTTVNLQNVVEQNTIIIEDKSENTTIILQEGEEVFLPVTATFSASSSLVNAGDVVTFTWTSENATKVLLQGVEVPLNGSKDIVFNESEQVVFIAYNGGFQVATSEIITVVQPDDERITYANRIAEDGGEIVGFDQLEDNINAPVGRKEGKLYAYNEDDYSVIANGERFELTRNYGYKSVGVDVPRFDWSNGIQELLVEGQATFLALDSDPNTDPNNGNLTRGVEWINSDLIGLGFNSATKLSSIYAASIGNTTSIYRPIQGLSNGITRTFSFFCMPLDGNPPILSTSVGSEIEIIVSPATDIKIERISNTSVFRCSFKSSDTSTFGSIGIQQRINYTGGREFYITGFNVVENQDVSSYVYLDGTSIVTRPADIITNSQGQLAPGRYDSI